MIVCPLAAIGTNLADYVLSPEEMPIKLIQYLTSLEELKSTNEELQSTNEELQSTNEESLTAKEEMQSLNEELMTINMQYQSKAEELTLLNNDMKNLLDATEIGTIFLDTDLNILRYTPQVRKLFNIIPTDVGRPVSHVVSNFDYQSIEGEIAEVLDKLTTREIEIKTRTGEWYKLRIIPYRILDNFISGVVLTFTVITGYKQIEYQLNALQQYASAVANLRKDAVLQLNKHLVITYVNEAFLKLFNTTEKQLIDEPFADVVKRQWKTRNIDKFLAGCSRKETRTTITLHNDESEKVFNVVGQPFYSGENQELFMILMVIEEQ